MREADLILEHAAELVTPVGSSSRTGKEQGEIRVVPDAALAVDGETIVYAGPSSGIDRAIRPRPSARRIDARGRTLLPGFVDPHTHLPFAGSRETEFEQRLAGRTYREIAAAGGGILSTVRRTREASEEDLVAASLPRLRRMLEGGTTTIEAKSGYGLSLEAEIRQLRALRELAGIQPVEIVPTFLGAHTVPLEHRESREAYVREVVEEMIPRVAEEGLAEYCDVFCEEGAFTPAETERILEAGRRRGLRARLHADQLTGSGGAELAARFEAASADHLEFVSEEGIAAMSRAKVAAVLLPSAGFFLMSRERPPARALIEAGVPVALATDLNPGTSMTESMALVLVLACLQLRMTAAEAITAATLNAAACLGRADRVGSLEEGKQADVQVLDIPNHRHLVYHFGVSHVETVLKKGKVAYEKHRAGRGIP
jgi:imidazolonepropionase